MCLVWRELCSYMLWHSLNYPFFYINSLFYFIRKYFQIMSIAFQNRKSFWKIVFQHPKAEGRRPKPIKLLLSSGCKSPSQSVGQSKRLPISYTRTPSDIIIMIKHFCIYIQYAPMTCWSLIKRICYILFCNK